MPTKKTETADDVAETMGEQCIAVRVRILNRTITALYDQALRPLGLTAGQLNVLVAISRRGPLSPGAISKRLSMEKSTVSRNLARMKENGWLTVRETEHGNQHCLSLSRKGNALLKKSLPVWETAQAEAKELLGKEGTESLLDTGNTVWERLLEA